MRNLETWKAFQNNKCRNTEIGECIIIIIIINIVLLLINNIPRRAIKYESVRDIITLNYY